MHEAIILGGKPVFLKFNSEEGKFETVDKIVEGIRVIRPPHPEEYHYQPYEFSSIEEVQAIAAEAKLATIDTLYETAKAVVKEYNDQDEVKLVLNSVDITFSYFQDRFPTTHYVNIVGDNDSGKSSMGITAEATAYRPVYMTDPSAANIFRCLGVIEQGQCTIIIDEADKIDKSPEMMAILKTGYQLNGKVPKINTNSLKQEFFYTFGMKWIISERSMGLNEAKGVYDRTFSYTTYPGESPSDIKETLNPQGNLACRQKLIKLLYFRNLMLIYRLIHFDDVILDIEIGLKRRNKELCKPILQLFCNAKSDILNEIVFMLQYFLKTKGQRKDNTLEASLYTILKALLERGVGLEVDHCQKEISTSMVWDTIVIEGKIAGYYDSKRPNEYQTADFGTIYRTSISKIICDKFGTVIKHKENGNFLIFDIAKLAKAGKSYESNTTIKIERVNAEGTEGAEGIKVNPSNTKEESNGKTFSSSADNSNICEENACNNINNLKDTIQKSPTPSSILSSPSGPSANLPHDIYWSNSRYHCHNCDMHGDRPYMTKETTCKRNVKMDTIINKSQYPHYYCNDNNTNKIEMYDHHVPNKLPKKTTCPRMTEILLIQNSVDLRDVHPFVKWAGGKCQLLHELNKMIPSQFNSYFEPFLGGGAMLFNLVSRGMLKGNAYLSDTNIELINAYKVAKANPRGVSEFLQRYDIEYKRYGSYSEEQKAYYKQLKYALNKKQFSNDVERAALFIMLNRTCFNGLWRVNRRGEFNVPPGKYKNPQICDSSNLENVSNALARATILADDYRNVTQNAQEGDFIYLDPPYQPLNSTSNFTAYTKNGFDDKNQLQLAEVFRKLNTRGCLLLLSNSDTPFIRNLYSNFSIKEVDAQRAINSKGSKRTGHKELLISNYSA